MKYLKRFNENQSSDIEIICNQYGIGNYTIHPDGTVDVDGDVDLHIINLTKLPLKFGKVTGYFDCSNNQLTSLEGAPKEVGGYVDCHRNLLTSLEGAPKEVGGDFYCHYNQLTTLEGSPIEVGGDFDCRYNQLTTLEGGPKEVGGGFNCSNNELRTLEGVSGDFYCDGNPIEIIYELFKSKFPEFLYKINFFYTDLFNGPDMIRGDILEQIAEELEIELPVDWVEKLEKEGYQII